MWLYLSSEASISMEETTKTSLKKQRDGMLNQAFVLGQKWLLTHKAPEFYTLVKCKVWVASLPTQELREKSDYVEMPSLRKWYNLGCSFSWQKKINNKKIFKKEELLKAISSSCEG